MDGPAERIRVDKWLFHARFYKTRPLAQAACGSGRIRLNGARVEKPGAFLKLGDVLTVPFGREVVVVKVLACGERRGPAAEARLLYEIMTESA